MCKEEMAVFGLEWHRVTKGGELSNSAVPRFPAPETAINNIRLDPGDFRP